MNSLPHRDQDPPDDPTLWLITYRLEGEVVERERVRGDLIDAERAAKLACQSHEIETRDKGDWRIGGEKLDYTIEPGVEE